jgi:predicted dinucleotide-utilizing enzyme
MFVKNKINLVSITASSQMCQGFADEATRQFPKNANVTVPAALVGPGPQKPGLSSL